MSPSSLWESMFFASNFYSHLKLKVNMCIYMYICMYKSPAKKNWVQFIEDIP